MGLVMPERPTMGFKGWDFEPCDVSTIYEDGDWKLAILKGDIKNGSTVTIDAEDGQFKFLNS